MSKKDYDRSATAFKGARRQIEANSVGDDRLPSLGGRLLTVSLVPDVLGSDNGRFQRDKFLKACGVKEQS